MRLDDAMEAGIVCICTYDLRLQLELVLSLLL
ncbi:MAG: hypothetical protein N838_04740 [Thiohalocapsa sp. PB-PSB1]|nr:MAG: hypothetical protein N838_04740 [Thiohalocapsa sp. PB-PSB1]